MITLYDYYRSSAAFRVRIVLNLKGIDYQSIPINLIKEGGEHLQEKYKKINPQGLIPCLVTQENQIITQSLAISTYLEEIYPTPSIMPNTPYLRAQANAIALTTACDIHPLNNLRVLKYVTDTLSCSEEEKIQWYHHWLHEGFNAIEALLKENTFGGKCCIGNIPSIADVCLIPQVYNAKRYHFNMAHYPRIQEISDYCLTLDAFEKALPE